MSRNFCFFTVISVKVIVIKSHECLLNANSSYSYLVVKIIGWKFLANPLSITYGLVVKPILPLHQSLVANYTLASLH